MAKGELNVVFHGQFAFVFTRECVEVIVPVTPAAGTAGHNLCMAGSRGGPIGLTENYSYCLTGVTPGKSAPRFLKDDTPVLEDFRVINRARNALFCSLYLPQPAKMTAQRCMPGGSDHFFLGSGARNIVCKRIALVNTFVYEYPNHANVHLGDLAWTPVPGVAVNKLHVFSDSPRDTDPQAGHAKEAFKYLTRLFPAMQLELVNEPLSGSIDARNDNNQADDDLRSLAELSLDAGGTVRPQVPETPHCVSLFVDNT